MEQEILDTIKKNEVIAIIPARSGSKGVKDKNIRCLNGYPMIAYSIAVAKMSKLINRVIVSTDSEQYAKVAEYYGAEIPFLRPPELASDQSADIGFISHAINWLYINEQSVPEYLVHLRPTYPIRDCNIINEAIIKIKNDIMATSLRSAYHADVSPFKWFQMELNGYFKPMYGDMTLDDANKPRQVFPPVYIPDGYVDVLKTSYIVKNNLLHGDKMIGFVVDKGIDVDTYEDMQNLQRILMDIDMPPVLSFLKENYKPLGEVHI